MTPGGPSLSFSRNSTLCFQGNSTTLFTWLVSHLRSMDNYLLQEWPWPILAKVETHLSTTLPCISASCLFLIALSIIFFFLSLRSKSDLVLKVQGLSLLCVVAHPVAGTVTGTTVNIQCTLAEYMLVSRGPKTCHWSASVWKEQKDLKTFDFIVE